MKTSLESAYDRCLIQGGFPGVQTLDAPARTLMLQSYVRDVMARDVVERSSRLDVTIATQMALFAPEGYRLRFLGQPAPRNASPCRLSHFLGYRQ